VEQLLYNVAPDYHLPVHNACRRALCMEDGWGGGCAVRLEGWAIRRVCVCVCVYVRVGAHVFVCVRARLCAVTQLQ